MGSVDWRGLERVSIRDLPTILESISEACSVSRNVGVITEHVRQRLTRQITFNNVDENNVLKIVTLSSAWEKAMSEALIGDGEVKQLALPPSQIQEFVEHFQQVYNRITMTGEQAVLVTTASLRPYIRSIVERIRGATIVMSQNEVHPGVKIQTVAQV